MSFSFNIKPQQLSGTIFRPINTQTTTKAGEAELFGINNSNINSGNYVDSFVRTSPQQNPQVKQQKGFDLTYQKYYNAQTINNALNGNIQDICDKNGINPQVNAQQIVNIDKKHLEKTYEYSMMMANRMGLTSGEKEDLKTASILHDIGKAYIPDEILNKPGKLNEQEKKVMSSHSELGGELARQLGANDNVVDMIKNHHTDSTDNKLYGILQTADRYSALTQKRSYKDSYSSESAFETLDKEVQEGKLNGEALNALKQSMKFNNFYNPMMFSSLT